MSLQVELREDEFLPVDFYFFGIVGGERGNLLKPWKNAFR